MTKQYSKLDADTIKIVDTVIPVPQVTTYTYIYKDLVARKNQLLAEQSDYNARVEKEMAELDEAIANADSLGINKIKIN